MANKPRCGVAIVRNSKGVVKGKRAAVMCGELNGPRRGTATLR